MGKFTIIGDYMSLIVVFITILAIFLYSIRKYRLADILFVLLILYYMPQIQWSSIFKYEFIIYFIFGIIASQYIMKVFSKFFFKNYIIKERNFLRITWSNLVTAVYEETIWRYLMVYFVSIILNSLFSNYILVMILTLTVSLISFLVIHDFNSRRQLIEFNIFGIILINSSIFFPGMNIGLHLGRNCFLANNNGDEVK